VVAAVVVEYVPGRQSVHVMMLVAAVVPEYFPAMHSVQVEMLVAAVVPEYFPAMQEVHAEPDQAYFPAVQSEHSLFPVELDFPAGHAVHAAENDVGGPLRTDQSSVSRAFPDTGDPM
jgi:hypothetical protein